MTFRTIQFVVILIAAMSALATAAASGQSVSVNGHPLSLVWKAQDDFSDLSPLFAQAKLARIVHLQGDGGPVDDAFHRARRRLIRFLHEKAGYTVVVLPVGIFEGAWTNSQLRSGQTASKAAEPLYRVWRQSEPFLDILRYVQQVGPDLEVIGGLCRYHAAGKELYAPHLIEFFDSTGRDLIDADLKERLLDLWGGRLRLSRATQEKRSAALIFAEAVLQHFEAVRSELEASYRPDRIDLERQFLLNMRLFAELERIRAGDVPPDGLFANREKGLNLEWFLGQRFRARKIIYWEGRGANTQPLPTKEPVFVIRLSSEGH